MRWLLCWKGWILKCFDKASEWIHVTCIGSVDLGHWQAPHCSTMVKRGLRGVAGAGGPVPVRAVVHGGEAAVAAHPQLRRPGLRVPAVRAGPLRILKNLCLTI